MTDQLFAPDDRGAELSGDGVYRYRLWHGTEPRLGFIMCNPSRADANTDDATVKSCVRIASHNGFRGIDIANMFAYRATEPDDIPDDIDGATGDVRNIDALIAVIDDCPVVVVAWGAVYANVAARVGDRHGPAVVTDIADAADTPLMCLGYTNGGHPRHPCRLAAATPLQPWVI